MNNKTYFMIDGSCLFAAIRELQRNRIELKDKKLQINKFSDALINKWRLYVRETIRIVFYFKKNDSRIKNMLFVPDTTIPGTKNHWLIKEYAESNRTIPENELEKLSKKYHDVFPRAEKGLDIKLVCDTLQLVATEKADNIVLYVNDSDYIPLFETLQNLGVNVYLTSIDSKKKINKKLAELADAYLAFDEEIDYIFV